MDFPEDKEVADVTLFNEFGEPVSLALLSRATFNHYVEVGTPMALGSLSADECYMKDSVVVKYTTEQRAERMRSPKGYSWDASAFKWADCRDIVTLKESKIAEINAKCSAALKSIKAGYPDGEVDSWSKQELEARAYALLSTSPTPLLSALATARKIDIGILVEKIIEKADAFACASGAIIGVRQRCEDLIALATTNGDVDNVDVNL